MGRNRQKYKPFSKGGSVQTALLKLQQVDGPDTRGNSATIRPKSMKSNSMSQHEIGKMLVAGLDVILENRMHKQRTRHGV